MKTIFITLTALLYVFSGYGQSMEALAKDLPSHFSILTTWGLRPEWDETSENIYFLNKIVGDVFKINVKTKEVTCVTCGFYHAGIFRVLCLKNGDLLLGIGGEKFDPAEPEKNRYNLGMYILKKDDLKNPVYLGEHFDEGPAVSRNHMKIAWTLYGQREIKMADIVYSNGIPELVNEKTIVNYNDSMAYMRLETQDFRPPHDEELIYTHYWGDANDAFHHSQTYGYNINTGVTTDYTHLPDSYNEAEGIFPDGKYIMIESDRHQPMERRNQYKLDIYKLKLDGSGEVERLADFSTRYPGMIRSDNPVVDRTGKYIALQYGFMKGAGDGQGIFLFDIEEYEKSKFVTDSQPDLQNQILPEVKHVSAVAHDVICIEVDEGRLLPIIQVPYHAESSDIITIHSRTPLGEPRSVSVERNGTHLGDLVGKDRKTLVILERVVGMQLDSSAADLCSNYMIRSFGHKEYERTISPLKVWRKTKPTNWAIDKGWPGTAYTARHYLYLKLPCSLKTGESYLLQIKGLNLKKTNIHYTHDPINNRSDAVHVSQIGFRTDDPCKYAYLSTWMGTGGGYTYPENIEFSIIEENSSHRVFSGKGVMQWKGDVPEGIGSKVNHSGTDVIRLDFSAFNTPGRYRLFVEGIGCGYSFSIGGEETWKNAFLTSLKGLYVHRSGVAMGPPYSDFVRPRSFHPNDGVEVYQSTCPLLNSGNGLNALGTDKNNFGNLCAGITDMIVEDAWGGLMDAGDWDRRIQHLDVSRLLLELMQLSPDYFMNVSLNIPESNNELPDILDEALYGLDLYRRLQLPDGGIRGGIESSEHPSGDLSWHDQLINMAYAADHWSGFIYAGVAARAAFVLKMLGEHQKAQVWEESSVKAMEWSEIEYQKWIGDKGYESLRERAKKEVPLERNLAAVELYRLTEKSKWHEVYLESQNFPNNNTNAAFIYATLNKSLVKEEAHKKALNFIFKEADLLLELSGKSAYGITTAIPGKALGGWAATYSIPASRTLVRAHYLSGDQDYLKTIIRSSLFSAGANPMNLVLTTGLGENPVIHPLHIDSRFTGQPAPVGITVCGPCEIPVFGTTDNVHGIRINRECIPAALQWPSAESYFDVYRWASMNEYTVDNTMGPSAYIWGYLASRK